MNQDNGEALYLSQNLPFTTDPATAQRLLKIYMMRTRFQSRVTVRLSMKAFVCTPLDVIALTNPRYGWSNETFEVLSATMVNESGSENPHLYMQLDLALTDSSIYDWLTSEEMSATGFIQPDNMGGTRTATEPNDLTLYSGPGATIGGVTYPNTVSVGSDGTAHNSLFATWTPPNDAFVTSGGQIQIQHQIFGSSDWISDPSVAGDSTSVSIPNVTDGQLYNVRIRSVNVVGAYSEWLMAGPHTESDSQSIFTSSTGFNSLGWTATQLIVVNYSVTNAGAAFTWAAQTIQLADGSTLHVPTGSLSYTSLSASTTYYSYWYVNAATGALGQTNSNPPATTPSSLLLAQCSLQGRIAMPTISFTTLAASNPGTGSGTGGGGDTCPEASEQIETQNRGAIAAGDVKVGDLLKGRSFKSGTDVYRKVIQVVSKQSSTWRTVDGHRVSPCEAVYSGDKWIPAYRATGATVDTTLGTKMFISIESDEYDEQNYYLSGDQPLLIHNVSAGSGGFLPC